MSYYKTSLSDEKFNKLFDRVMSHVLQENYEAPLYTNEQILSSWEIVHQRLGYEKTHRTKED